MSSISISFKKHGTNNLPDTTEYCSIEFTNENFKIAPCPGKVNFKLYLGPYDTTPISFIYGYHFDKEGFEKFMNELFENKPTEFKFNDDIEFKYDNKSLIVNNYENSIHFKKICNKELCKALIDFKEWSSQFYN